MTRNSGSPTSTFPGGDYKQSGTLGLGFGSVGREDLLVEAGVPVISFSGHSSPYSRVPVSFLIPFICLSMYVSLLLAVCQFYGFLP